MPSGATLVKVACLSGGLAGLAGAIEVMGVKGYVTTDLSPGFGYAGIVVAMLATLSPIGVVAAAIFSAAMFVGADSMSRALERPELHRRRHRGAGAPDDARGAPSHHLQDPPMSVVLDVFASAGLWEAVLRIATPLIFGTLGALLCERAGVLNLGIEGIMTFGAMIAWLTVFGGGDLWVGLAGGGAVRGGVRPPARGDDGAARPVASTSPGSASRCWPPRCPTTSSASRCRCRARRPPSRRSSRSRWAWLEAIPFVGAVLAAQTPPTFLALALVPFLAWMLAATPLGLAIRMTGENPHAAEAQGIDPIAMRIGAVVAGSALMALGGAFLTLSAFNSFFPTMVQGRGWVCIALVVFAMWRPWRALLGALLFALFDAYQLRLQAQLGKEVPYQLFLMMPYLLSIAALVVMARRAQVPQALMQPYRRGER